MNKEIEKKYVIPNLKVIPEDCVLSSTIFIKQVYVYEGENCILRFRHIHEENVSTFLYKEIDNYILTYKERGEQNSYSRTEIEDPITKEIFEGFWKEKDLPKLSKTRYTYFIEDNLKRQQPQWYSNLNLEIDCYTGVLEGLITAEVEFSSEERCKAFDLRLFIPEAVDVSFDNRFKNNNLCRATSIPKI